MLPLEKSLQSRVIPSPKGPNGHGLVSDSGRQGEDLESAFSSSASKRIARSRASISFCTCFISSCFRRKAYRVGGLDEWLADLRIGTPLRQRTATISSTLFTSEHLPLPQCARLACSTARRTRCVFPPIAYLPSEPQDESARIGQRKVHPCPTTSET